MALGHEMDVLDVHCHYATDEAYVFRTDEERRKADDGRSGRERGAEVKPGIRPRNRSESVARGAVR